MNVIRVFIINIVNLSCLGAVRIFATFEFSSFIAIVSVRCFHLVDLLSTFITFLECSCFLPIIIDVMIAIYYRHGFDSSTAISTVFISPLSAQPLSSITQLPSLIINHFLPSTTLSS